MQTDKKFTSIISIPSFSEANVKDAEKLFLSYKKENIILASDFKDEKWHLCDEYSNVNLRFDIDKEAYEKSLQIVLDMSYSDFVKYLKTYVVYRLGETALLALQGTILTIKKIVLNYEKLDDLIEDDLPYIGRVAEFFDMLPRREDAEEKISDFIEKLEAAEDSLRSFGGQRELASFESYALFSDLLDKFWEEETDKDTKLFFFPIYLWWKVTSVIPLRPREFVLTPRYCLDGVPGKYMIKLRNNRLKGSGKKHEYKIDKDYVVVQYQIPDKLAKQIIWYMDQTRDLPGNELGTLFVTIPHYNEWDRNVPINSRYLTYTNFRTILRYFYQNIIHERYGYEVIFDKEKKHLRENEIQFLTLGDTRHIAFINIIAEGGTPLMAMLFGGHSDINMSAHYYTNIKQAIACNTARKYRRLKDTRPPYAVMSPQKPLSATNALRLEPNGFCTNEGVQNGDFSACSKILGKNGTLGYCPECEYYRPDTPFGSTGEWAEENVSKELETLVKIVSAYRQNKGDDEDVIAAVLKYDHALYSYSKYLEEKETQNGETEKD